MCTVLDWQTSDNSRPLITDKEMLSLCFLCNECDRDRFPERDEVFKHAKQPHQYQFLKHCICIKKNVYNIGYCSVRQSSGKRKKVIALIRVRSLNFTGLTFIILDFNTS